MILIWLTTICLMHTAFQPVGGQVHCLGGKCRCFADADKALCSGVTMPVFPPENVTAPPFPIYWVVFGDVCCEIHDWAEVVDLGIHKLEWHYLAHCACLENPPPTILIVNRCINHTTSSTSTSSSSTSTSSSSISTSEFTQTFNWYQDFFAPQLAVVKLDENFNPITENAFTTTSEKTTPKQSTATNATIKTTFQTNATTTTTTTTTTPFNVNITTNPQQTNVTQVNTTENTNATQPVTTNATLQPTNATQLYISTNATQQTIVTNATQQPTVTNATQQPIVTNATQQPMVTNATQQPVVTNATHQPPITNATQQPFVTNATQLITNATQQPIISNATQFITNATQQPIISNATHSITNATQLMTNATHQPPITNATQIPLITNATKPTNATTQQPATTNATQYTINATHQSIITNATEQTIITNATTVSFTTIATTATTSNATQTKAKDFTTASDYQTTIIQNTTVAMSTGSTDKVHPVNLNSNNSKVIYILAVLLALAIFILFGLLIFGAVWRLRHGRFWQPRRGTDEPPTPIEMNDMSGHAETSFSGGENRPNRGDSEATETTVASGREGEPISDNAEEDFSHQEEGASSGNVVNPFQEVSVTLGSGGESIVKIRNTKTHRNVLPEVRLTPLLNPLKINLPHIPPPDYPGYQEMPNYSGNDSLPGSAATTNIEKPRTLIREFSGKRFGNFPGEFYQLTPQNS